MFRRSFLSISNNTKIKRLYPFSKKINFIAKKNLFSINNKKVKEDKESKLLTYCLVTGSSVGFITGINNPLDSLNPGIHERLICGLVFGAYGTFAGASVCFGLYITPPILCIFISGCSIIYINDSIKYIYNRIF